VDERSTAPAEQEPAWPAPRISDRRRRRRNGRDPGGSARQATDVLVRVLAERHPDLGAHVDEVAGLVERVARRMGLPADEMEELVRAAALHDVGKSAVPDAILHKAGPLDEAEWEVMRRHTEIGERIIAAAPALAPVAKFVRWSHERWDGAGYPDRLAGEAIPLGARIIAVCDAFDAMTAPRPYRPAWSLERAVAELRRCSGTQFDPLAVEAVCAELGAAGPQPQWARGGAAAAG
jgi:two-component system, cell cycle response regulator